MSKDNHSRAVIYLRVSTAAQTQTAGDEDGLSIAAQRQACLTKAQSLEAEVVDEYVDRGESARSADRPALQSMLKRLKDDRDVDYVICHKLDRMARNRADDVEIELGIRRAGAKLVSVSENIDDTPSGILLHGVIASVAEFYSANLAAEVKKGMNQKAMSGTFPGKAPIGYRNATIEIDRRPKRTIVLDEERSDFVKWCFEEYATGNWTLRSLLAEVTKMGLRQAATRKYPIRPMPLRSMSYMLNNPFYTGVFLWKGVEYPGDHEPLISRQLFEDVQAVLKGNNTSGTNKSWQHKHYLKGTVFCSRCQARLGYSVNKGRGGEYEYFYCLGRQRKNGCDLPYLPAGLVEEKVEDAYKTKQLDEPRKEEILGLFAQQLESATKYAEKEIARSERRLGDLEKQRDKLMQAHYADAITIDQMKKEQSRISREVIDAELQLEAANTTLGPIEKQVRNAMEYFERSPAAYLTADDEGRREMNHTWWKRVLVDDEESGETELAELASTLLDERLPERLRLEVAAMKDATVERDFWDQIRGESKIPDTEHVGVEDLAEGSTPGFERKRFGARNRTTFEPDVRPRRRRRRGFERNHFGGR